jgi:hypothetical protein
MNHCGLNYCCLNRCGLNHCVRNCRGMDYGGRDLRGRNRRGRNRRAGKREGDMGRNVVLRQSECGYYHDLGYVTRLMKDYLSVEACIGRLCLTQQITAINTCHSEIAPGSGYSERTEYAGEEIRKDVLDRDGDTNMEGPFKLHYVTSRGRELTFWCVKVEW